MTRNTEAANTEVANTEVANIEPVATATPAIRRQGLSQALHSEWIKFWTVRSTMWSVVALFVLGAGLTAIICATSAEWLASDGADESVGSFITWGMMVAQITALVLGTLVVTSEYGNAMIRATLAATPKRGTVLLAKALVLSATLFVAGTLTAFAGYFAGNFFLDREGIGMALSDDGVLRAMFGSGLYMAALGLFAAAVGLIVRHTAAALSVVLAVFMVLGNMAILLPGTWGEWVAKLMPSNAGAPVSKPVPFNPYALEPWMGFGVFAAETALLLAVAYVIFQRRDA